MFVQKYFISANFMKNSLFRVYRYFSRKSVSSYKIFLYLTFFVSIEKIASLLLLLWLLIDERINSLYGGNRRLIKQLPYQDSSMVENYYTKPECTPASNFSIDSTSVSPRSVNELVAETIIATNVSSWTDNRSANSNIHPVERVFTHRPVFH